MSCTTVIKEGKGEMVQAGKDMIDRESFEKTMNLFLDRRFVKRFPALKRDVIYSLIFSGL